MFSLIDPFIALLLVMFLHVMEEAFFKWPDWVRKMTGFSHIGWLDFTLVNAVMFALGGTGALVRWEYPVFSLANASLVVINGILFHLLPTLKTRVYSPGLVTGIVLYIPAGTWLYIEAFKEGILNSNILIFSILLGCFYMSLPMLIQFMIWKKAKASK
ncbi:MAG: HXXEE domain-containing protein [Bacillota bacterium]